MYSLPLLVNFDSTKLFRAQSTGSFMTTISIATGSFLLRINTSVVPNSVQKLSCKFYSMTTDCLDSSSYDQGQSTCRAMLKHLIVLLDIEAPVLVGK